MTVKKQVKVSGFTKGVRENRASQIKKKFEKRGWTFVGFEDEVGHWVGLVHLEAPEEVATREKRRTGVVFLTLALGVILPLWICSRPDEGPAGSSVSSEQGSPNPTIAVSVRDPEGVAARTAVLFAGAHPDQMQKIEFEGRTFPLNLSLEFTQLGPVTFRVEARDAKGTLLAHGELVQEGTAAVRSTAVVSLRAPTRKAATNAPNSRGATRQQRKSIRAELERLLKAGLELEKYRQKGATDNAMMACVKRMHELIPDADAVLERASKLPRPSQLHVAAINVRGCVICTKSATFRCKEARRELKKSGK